MDAQSAHDHAQSPARGDLVAGLGGHVTADAGHAGARPVDSGLGQSLGTVAQAQPEAREPAGGTAVGGPGRVDAHPGPGRARTQGALQHPGAPGAGRGHALGDDRPGREADDAAGAGELAGEQGVLAAGEPVARVEAQPQALDDGQVQEQVAGVGTADLGAVGGLPGVEGT